ncbi:MAG: hypothetical protein Kow0063_38280 [Anaerolineae bacterium]
MNTPYDFKASHKNWITYLGLWVAVILLITGGTGNLTVAAQEPYRWSPDQRVPDYLDDTYTPFLLADQNRTVHAFANQWVGDENSQLAIVYRQWSLDGGWTAPVDILLSPVGGAQILGAFLDQEGMMHVAFWGGEARAASLYYARAPAANAGRAPAWSSPRLVGEGLSYPPSGALVGDDKGNLVIVYSGNRDGNGVYESHSSDAGDSWSEPAPIFLTYDPDLVPFSVRATMGHSGQLHAVWNVVTFEGNDKSVHYARLDVASQQWSDPVLLEERIDKEGFFGPSFPVVADAGDRLVVMYNSGNPDTGGPVAAGRPVQRVRLSNDGGRTWRGAETPFPNHLGRSGEHSLVVDSNNVVHALFMQRIETSVNGVPTVIDGPWHSALSGNNQWSEPNNFRATWSPHDLRAVVSQGNVLLVTWRQDPGEGQNGVWYSYTMLDAPELPVVPLPTPSPTPTATATPAPTPPSPTPTPMRPASISQEPASGRPAGAPAIPLVLGLVPVVLLLAGIILVQQLQHYRRP